MSKFRKTQNFDKIIFIFANFEENFAKTKLKISWKLREITTNSKTNSSIFDTEIYPSHYGLELISEMLKFEHEHRISSSDVVIQLISVKQKVIILY